MVRCSLSELGSRQDGFHMRTGRPRSALPSGAQLKAVLFARANMDQNSLKKTLYYDPAKGLFKWKKRRLGVGRDLSAGSKMKSGYVTIGIDGKQYYAHRLAWIYVHGSIPDGFNVDHLNGNRSDNRISNLQLETQSQNNFKNRSPAKSAVINSEGLREVIRYDPDTGWFFWVNAGHKIKAGQRADKPDSDEGYLCINLNNRSFKAHRLAWVYMHGPIPSGMDIDHINRNRSDNKIENLRLCTRAQNCQNTAKPRSNNSTGFLGVSYQKQCKKFVAYIGVNGKRTTIGRYNTAEEASAAYLEAKRRLHPFFQPT